MRFPTTGKDAGLTWTPVHLYLLLPCGWGPAPHLILVMPTVHWARHWLSYLRLTIEQNETKPKYFKDEAYHLSLIFHFVLNKKGYAISNTPFFFLPYLLSLWSLPSDGLLLGRPSWPLAINQNDNLWPWLQVKIHTHLQYVSSVSSIMLVARQLTEGKMLNPMYWLHWLIHGWKNVAPGTCSYNFLFQSTLEQVTGSWPNPMHLLTATLSHCNCSPRPLL